jgi:transposase
MASLPDFDSLDTEAMKSLLMQQHRQLSSKAHEIEHLKLVIEKLRRQIFGAKSEKVAAQLEQLELQLDELEAAQAAAEIIDIAEAPMKSRPFRRPLPEHLPREVVTYTPE